MITFYKCGVRLTPTLLLACIVLQAQPGSRLANETSPLLFDANLGQTDPTVKFLTHNNNVALFLTESGMVWSWAGSSPLAGPSISVVLRTKLLKADRPQIEGLEPAASRSNYILGNDPHRWRTNIPRFAKVRYRGVYPGIDLVLYGNTSRFEYDFVVAPGADPGVIRFSFEGAARTWVDERGDLVIHTAAGDIREHKPMIYQQADGIKKQIPGRYIIARRHGVGFEVSGYDRSLPLVIDPIFTISATYLGGSDVDIGQGIAVDKAGNAYLTGYTGSVNFPTTTGVFQRNNRGAQNVFITKLNPKTGIIYSTYLGGSQFDRGKGIAVDAMGNAYITGYTNSTDFPTTPAAFQTTGGGICGSGFCVHGFVAKLDPSGSGLLYSTYIASTPGSGNEIGSGIALDGMGAVYITGTTSSAAFPTTPGAFQTKFGGGTLCGGNACDDTFVLKLNPSGSAPVFSTYLGGTGEDFAGGIAIDSAGNAYVTGGTSSTNFPVTEGAFQSTLKPGVCNGAPCSDAFVTMLNPLGSGLTYSTLLGGEGADNGQHVEVDPLTGFIHIIGTTGSRNFPTTPTAYQTVYGGGASDMFVSVINPSSGLFASTFLGGSGADRGSSLAIGNGAIFVVGDMASTNVMPGATFASQGILGQFDPMLITYWPLWKDNGDGSNADVALLNGTKPCLTGAAGPSDQLLTGPQSPQPAMGGGTSDSKMVCVDDAPLDTQFAASLTIDDPISASSGELYDRGIGFVLGGPLRIIFEWYYSTGLSASGFSGALGNNRMHNFEVKLSIRGSLATATLRDGKIVRFVQSGGTWSLQTPEQFVYQLINSSNGYQLLDPTNRLIYTFSSVEALTGIQDRNGNTLTVTPGAGGPTDIADGLGRSLHFSYDAGKLQTVTDQSGRSISFGFTGNDLTSYTDPNGAVTTYSYVPAGSAGNLLATSKLPAGNTPYTQTYNNQGQVTAQTDSQGNATKFFYDEAGGVTTITDPRGNNEVDTNQDFTATLQQTDALGHNTAFMYDQNLRRVSLTDRLGNQTQISYHAATGYPASVIDGEGNTTSYVYTGQKQGGFTFYNLTEIHFPDGASTSFSYDAVGNVLSGTDQLGKVSSFTYNARGQQLTATNSAGGVTTIIYNADGTLASRQGPARNITSYTYDDKKRVQKITFADKTFRSFTYDALDRPLSMTNEQGKVTTLVFDANGDLKSVTDALNNTTTVSRDADDLITAVTDGTGAATQFRYDATGSLAAAIDAAGEKTTYSYDSLNRLISLADASSKGPGFTYDSQGDMIAFFDALSNTFTFSFDKVGRITRVTTPLGEHLDRAFDAMGRVTSTTNALSQITNFSYDPSGLLTSTSGPGVVSSSYVRDSLGYVSGITDPKGNTWKRKYDAAGRLMSRTDPLERAVTYSYDARNRMSGFSSTAGSLQLTYDAAGNATQRKYSDGTAVNLTYDDLNRPTGGEGLELGYDAAGRVVSSNGLSITRDVVGRISAITYGPGKAVAYKYNSRGLVSEVSDWAGGSATLSYDDASRLISISRANGVTTQYSYDQNSRMAVITEGSPGHQLASISLQRDAAGKITSESNTLPQAPNIAAGVLPLAYDAGDQVSGATYDSLGRITKDALRQYTWNLASELKSYSGADGSASFGYDGFGLRTSSSTSGMLQNYVLNYALGLPSIAIVRSGSADQRYYVFLPSGLLLYAIEAAGNLHHYYHFDQIGSTTFLTDDSGKITDTYGITPYGETVTVTGKTVNSFTWLGEWGVMQEGSTGLYYMRFRYYDSTTARFLSRDPVHQLDPRTIDPYQYATADPLSYVDPTGLKVVLGNVAYYGGLTLNGSSSVVNYLSNSVQAAADLRLNQAEALDSSASTEILNWFDAYLSGNVASEGEDGLLSQITVETQEQAAAWVNLRFGGKPGFSNTLLGEEAGLQRSKFWYQEVQQKVATAEGEAAELSQTASKLKVAGKALAVAGIALQTGFAIADDIHNGASVTDTVIDGGATATGSALTLAGGPVLALVDLATGGSVSETFHNGVAGVFTAVSVTEGRTTSRDADAIRKSYTRSPFGRFLWGLGESLADIIVD